MTDDDRRFRFRHKRRHNKGWDVVAQGPLPLQTTIDGVPVGAKWSNGAGSDIIISIGEWDVFWHQPEHLPFEFKRDGLAFEEVPDDNADHDWELRGGTTGSHRAGTVPLSLWQCRACGRAATRHLTHRRVGYQNAVLDPPDIDEPCGEPAETTTN